MNAPKTLPPDSIKPAIQLANDVAEYLVRKAETNPLEMVNFLSVVTRAPQWFQDLVEDKVDSLIKSRG